ncbi:MAG: DUF4097 family beta strand repeat-containing protein [Verrucomicrobiota bacterium]
MNANKRSGARPSLLLISLLLIHPPLDNAAADLEEKLEKTFPISKTGKVFLENVNGDVAIKAWDRAEVKIVATKTARSQEALDRVTIEISDKPEEIKVITRIAKSNRKFFGANDSASVDYELMVPAEARLDKISTVNGKVEIQKVSGGVEASSVNGKVLGQELSGDVELSSVNGAVTASIRSVENEKRISLHTVNGTVTLQLPRDANAEITADTLNGGISTEFDLPVKKQFPVGQDLKARLGEGGGRVKLSTVNGSIRLQRDRAVALEK